jgi:cystathionine gamma-synthase
LQLIGKVIEKAAVADDHTCFIFSTPEAAEACKAFATTSRRGDDVLSAADITIRAFDIDVRLYAVFFPAAKAPVPQRFWTNSGLGISSRLAEESLKHLELLREVTYDGVTITPARVKEVPAHSQVRERIAALLERSPVGPPREAKVAPDDVYLFQAGMTAIYALHQYLLSRHNGSTVLFGFAFHSTIQIFEDFGPGFKLLGLGGPEELDELEAHLQAEAKEGRKVQAVWAEYPANPLLKTPDLGRLRALADRYHFALVVDDTIGSFCNVDVLGADGVDVVVTSLTKSFSGYADVMGGSAVLNPSSALYSDIKTLFREQYYNDYCGGDAAVLEHNSRDYLSRSARLNNNAARLVSYLQDCASDPASAVSRVWYPTTLSSSLPHYTARMRPSTVEFTPGYGCLFSVELESVESTVAFYDGLDIHHGPHLGAHLTLALPYVKGLYGKDLEWAAAYELRETQLRISVGLEESEALLDVFKAAVGKANALKAEGGKGEEKSED